jgi:hypothetical protein
MSRLSRRAVSQAVAVVAVAASLTVGCAAVAPGDGSGAAGRVPAALRIATSPSFGSTALPSPSSTSAAWVPASCATGQFTGVAADAAGNTVLTATVALCSAYAAKFGFALVAFASDRDVAFAYSGALVRYGQGGPTEVRAGISAALTSEVEAVCAMRSPTDHIACVRLTFPPSGPPAMEPIPFTDPLVSKPIVWVPEPATASPPVGFCGSCVDLKL